MPVKSAVLCVILILTACSHVHKKNAKNAPDLGNTKVSDVIQELTKAHPDDLNSSYISHYKDYLNSVFKIFESSGAEDQFDDYLLSLLDTSRALEKMERVIPQRYAKDTGKKPDAQSKDFQLYKTRVMTKFHDDLNEARVIKLKETLDQKTYIKLLNNKQNFIERSPSGIPEFLYPL